MITNKGTFSYSAMTFVIITLENWHETQRRWVTGTHKCFVTSLLNMEIISFYCRDSITQQESGFYLPQKNMFFAEHITIYVRDHKIIPLIIK